MRIGLPSKVVAALIVPFVLVATAAQGVTLMRCGSSVAIAASCCCHKESAPAPDAMISAAMRCCDQVAVPASQPQIEHRAVTSLAAPVAVAVVQEALPFVSGLRRALPVPRLDPPLVQSPLLATCSLLI